MMRVKCPGCGVVQEVDASLRGQLVQCGACDREFPALRRRKRRPRPLRDGWRYYTGAVSPFGWGLVGLVVLWLVGLALALEWPVLGGALLAVGSGLVLVGNLWITFIAYGDSHVFGMLCFGTCLFTYVYVFINIEETWRPASLAGVGFLFTLSGYLVSHLAGAPA